MIIRHISLALVCITSTLNTFAGTKCTQSEIDNITEAATASNSEVYVNCSLTLDNQTTITKRLIFEGNASSRLDLNCNGAHLNGDKNSINSGKDMIEIRSRRTNLPLNEVPDYPQYDAAYQWTPATNINIHKCNIAGSVRVWGMAKNGEGDDLRYSSQFVGHTKRAKDNAPSEINISNTTIVATGRIPLYLSPGVNNVLVENSTVTGNTVSVALYLDAESSNNTFRNNTIQAVTDKRELIAIDGSSNNQFIGNRFSSLNNGGVYFYRNCGEGGTVRHSTPTGNQIINNVFYYNKYKGYKPSIYLGSRNGNRSYCDDDAGYPFGSSENNRDYANNNIIAQNQIYKLSPSKMIEEGKSTDSPNFYFSNIKVSSANNHKSGCYLSNGSPNQFILDSHEFSQFTDLNGNLLAFSPYTYICNDGQLEPNISDDMIAILSTIITLI